MGVILKIFKTSMARQRLGYEVVNLSATYSPAIFRITSPWHHIRSFPLYLSSRSCISHSLGGVPAIISTLFAEIFL